MARRVSYDGLDDIGWGVLVALAQRKVLLHGKRVVSQRLDSAHPASHSCVRRFHTAVDLIGEGVAGCRGARAEAATAGDRG